MWQDPQVTARVFSTSIAGSFLLSRNLMNTSLRSTFSPRFRISRSAAFSPRIDIHADFADALVGNGEPSCHAKRLGIEIAGIRMREPVLRVLEFGLVAAMGVRVAEGKITRVQAGSIRKRRPSPLQISDTGGNAPSLRARRHNGRSNVANA